MGVRSNQTGYTYLKKDGQYQLYNLIENTYKLEYLLYYRHHKALIEILKNEYNAIFKIISTISALYSVWFNTEKDAIAAIDYLTSFLIIDKLGENL